MQPKGIRIKLKIVVNSTNTTETNLHIRFLSATSVYQIVQVTEKKIEKPYHANYGGIKLHVTESS
jgi:hypothetical protein